MLHEAIAEYFRPHKILVLIIVFLNGFKSDPSDEFIGAHIKTIIKHGVVLFYLDKILTRF